MRGEVERDQEHDQQRMLGVRAGEETEQTRRGTSVGDHVEHGAELARLAECPSGHPVEYVQDARNEVHERADLRGPRQKVQRYRGGDDADVADDVGDEEVHILRPVCQSEVHATTGRLTACCCRPKRRGQLVQWGCRDNLRKADGTDKR